ncbi:DUF4307 domain-containing protein [Klebsiella pneumoniae]|uniref:DUF4307 domain-containing protein n=1 Tax=Haloactinopolyspora sp. TaxID=1966353 RepID=UPI001110EA51|nr:DUF4307 domain-containing protein [Haloactinopolyspora sp.]TMZ34636.1 DUF4307 domain-containing protein [Klebsiella pneumoniae]
MPDNQAENSDHLAERYGRRPSSDRGVTIAVTAAVIVLTVVVGWFAFRSVDDPLRVAVHSWDEPQGAALTTTIEIDRDPGVAATCDLVALDERMIVVGQLELEIPAGPEDHFRMSADIPLKGDGIAPELRECRITN